MAFSERAKAPRTPPKTGTPCSIGEVYRALGDDDTELSGFNALLYEQGKSGSEVYDDITAEGFDIGVQTVNKHRGRRCRCFKYEDWACYDCRYDRPHCRCEAAAA